LRTLVGKILSARPEKKNWNVAIHYTKPEFRYIQVDDISWWCTYTIFCSSWTYAKTSSRFVYLFVHSYYTCIRMLHHYIIIWFLTASRVSEIGPLGRE
jgi:hypothetical protein